MSNYESVRISVKIFKNSLLLYPVTGETNGTLAFEPQIIEGGSLFLSDV